MNKTIIKLLEELPPMLDEDLFFYFKPSYKLYLKDQKITLKVKASFLDLPHPVLQCKLNDEKIVDSFCSICTEKKCGHISTLLYKIYNENKEAINNEYQKLSLHISEIKKKEIQNHFNQIFQQLSFDIERKEHIESFNKVHITPVFDYHLNNNVAFKIGRLNEKEYSVANIANLKNAFNSNQVISYGKELCFDHIIEAFDDESIHLLNYLTPSLNIVFKGKFAIFSDDKSQSYIIDLYKNKHIYINNQKIYVCKQATPPKIHINKDYELSIVFKNEDDKLFYYHILSIHDGCIYPISDDKIYTQLILELYNFPNVCIKDFLENFKTSIFLKYQDLFIIDEEIKSDFNFTNITIQLFFDYDDKIIKVKEKLLYNNQEIKVTELDLLSKKIYLKCQRILDKYGVIDNEITDESNIINFLNADLCDLKKIAEVYLSESLTRLKVDGFHAPQIKISYNNNMLNVFMEDSIYDSQELYEILKAIQKKKKYVLLKGERIVTLTDNSIDTFKQAIYDLNLNDKQLDETQKIPVYNIFKAYAYEKNIQIDEYLSNMINAIAHFKKADYQLPLLNATLRPYQKDAFLWMKTLCNFQLGGILADDMGLGKTLEMIALLADDKEAKPSLIVCPKSLIFNWESEIQRFASYLKCIPIYGGSSNRNQIIEQISNNEKCIYITSYDSLRIDIDLIDKVLFHFVILDEGQFIKNVMALKTKSVKKIQAQQRFVLTGTPIENNIIDLWSIFDFIMPNYLPSLTEFKSSYEHDENYTQLITKKISPFILRRKKEEVLKDLPEKYDVVITCEMEEAQKKLYDAFKLQAKNILLNDGAAFDVLPMLTRLRQICVDPSMFVDNYTAKSGKMVALFDIINDRLIHHHRLLIFSQFVKCLEIIEKHLKDANINYKIITGNTSANERVLICNEFNKDESIKIVLISLKAGGTGLNLIGADTVVHVDPWWNVAAQNQATDRAHRIGQVKNVEIIRLICSDSIEQRVVELQNIKKELVDKIIANDDSSITNLSKDDMTFILK